MNDSEPQIGLRGYRIANATRAAERHAAVIKAAAHVFSAKGYRDATMSDIAQEMGVSKGVLYYQFRSKEEVFTEIIVTAIDEAQRLLNQSTDRGGSPADRLRRGIRELIAFNLEETTSGYYSKLVLGNMHSISAPNREKIRILERAYRRTLVELIRDGQALGVFAPGNALVAALNVLTAANGVSNWYRPGKSLNAGEVADQVSEELVRGLQ